MDVVKPVFMAWYRLGVQDGVIGTVPVEATIGDAAKAWKKVRFPKTDPVASVDLLTFAKLMDTQGP